MDSFSIWQGEQQVTQKLRLLADKKVVRRITRKAARRGMNIVRNEARQNAKMIDDPETAANIAKNIKVASGRVRNKDVISMRVGVDGGAAFNGRPAKITSGGDTRHWRFIELGTAYIPAIPFMRIAFYNNIDSVISTFAQVFSDELDLELAKL
ncbi:HK97-gp10 family putative phage morphogenesis protein [Acinetobacter sp. NIPH 298]|uniref:HK97-gp10 family putative phage morphogenesis protein n=1 Tax=Acinetobacter sp. NIPH 298 TaxID=1217692 RepID=UPI0002CDD4E1|nr:HK97-gp10 family putative phage morphogenesis protein [Acinetobacter sp. NIPH 298]ENW95969.1 HK97 gp10 family phage protein [Acinetobacter sp. NIPH 298]